ncbi:hypothetical protein TD95_002038 [Thielaviopsis punctulata]|uniref:Uncharacterized protein n=1 Tax=Thielaviopsis punctulata TaxID=72032 RepID=A0A0F4ZF98_9PEZI|nr:hypothetical protein TD95_002038 [Thielaviopsis punctulata]
MVRSTAALAFLAASAAAVPVAEIPEDSGVAKRAELDCSAGSKDGLQAGCWNQLDIPSYIDAWIKANGTAAKCSSLGFAQCYLQYNGYSGLTCNLITSNTCPPFATTDSAYDSPQQFYTLWNIYSIYQYFNQYSTALSDGSSLAGQTIGKIVSTVAPSVQATAPTSSLMTVLSGSISALTFVSGLIPGDVGTGAKLIVGGLSAMLKAGDAFASTLTTPSQTANQRFIELGDIGNSLATLVEQYQHNLLDAVQSVQGNETLFKAIGTDGAFSQRITTSLTVQSSELYHDMQLYVLSQSLKANGYVSSRSTDVNALDVAKQTSAISCSSLNSDDRCWQWWVDTQANNTYALHNPNDWSNTQISLSDAIFNNGWATPAEVYKVEDCVGKAPSFDAADVGVKCLTTHGFCEWHYESDLVAARSGKQWTDCNNDPSWGTLCSSWTDSILVPESYLGPLLLNENAFCKSL